MKLCLNIKQQEQVFRDPFFSILEWTVTKAAGRQGNKIYVVLRCNDKVVRVKGETNVSVEDEEVKEIYGMKNWSIHTDGDTQWVFKLETERDHTKFENIDHFYIIIDHCSPPEFEL